MSLLTKQQNQFESTTIYKQKMQKFSDQVEKLVKAYGRPQQKLNKLRSNTTMTKVVSDLAEFSDSPKIPYIDSCLSNSKNSQQELDE